MAPYNPHGSVSSYEDLYRDIRRRERRCDVLAWCVFGGWLLVVAMIP
jgi:hypothetical protein